MEQAHDHLIPASSILTRLENHRDEMRRELASTPWWRWRRRLMLTGAAATYSYEIEQLLGITSGWQPFWKTIHGRKTR